MYLYSVIIPHYNIPNLLNHAINSIPERNDIQIIVADNSYKSIIGDYSRSLNNHIEIIHTQHLLGAGHARNKALDCALGRWILFLDADDSFCEGAFDEFDKYSNTDLDIIIFKSESFYLGSQEKSCRCNAINKLIDNFQKNKPHSEDALKFSYHPVWGKMFNSTTIKNNNIRFDEVIAGNDAMFSIKASGYARKIAVSSFVAFSITDRKWSLTNNANIMNERSRFCVRINIYHYLTSIDRKAYRPLMLNEIFKGLRFNVSEFLWRIKTIRKEK